MPVKSMRNLFARIWAIQKQTKKNRFSCGDDHEKKSGALKATMDRAYEHANLAKDALAPLAARNGARILIEIADYCVERAA